MAPPPPPSPSSRIIGDALCVAAGWLRIPWPATLAFMAAGRLARYAVVAYLA